MILFLGITIIGIIVLITHVELSRQEIQRKQEALQKENEALQAVIKETDRQRKEESFNRIGEVEV